MISETDSVVVTCERQLTKRTNKIIPKMSLLKSILGHNNNNLVYFLNVRFEAVSLVVFLDGNCVSVLSHPGTVDQGPLQVLGVIFMSGDFFGDVIYVFVLLLPTLFLEVSRDVDARATPQYVIRYCQQQGAQSPN